MLYHFLCAEQLAADKLAFSRSRKVETNKYLGKIKEYEKFLGLVEKRKHA